MTLKWKTRLFTLACALLCALTMLAYEARARNEAFFRGVQVASSEEAEAEAFDAAFEASYHALQRGRELEEKLKKRRKW